MDEASGTYMGKVACLQQERIAKTSQHRGTKENPENMRVDQVRFINAGGPWEDRSFNSYKILQGANPAISWESS